MKTDSRIQTAAIRLVLTYGYDKTTVGDIAREAGVARSTIYTKWKTKEALFADVLRDETTRFARDWYRRVEADPQGGSFLGIYKNSLLAVRDNPFTRALYSENRRVLGSFVDDEQLARLMEDRLAWTTILFERMQAAGLVRPEVDARTVAQVAVIFRRGLLYSDFSSESGGKLAYEEVIDFFTAMFYQAMVSKDGEEDQAAGKAMLKAYLSQYLEQYAEE